jgi:small-conductance mechanosensitive channel
LAAFAFMGGAIAIGLGFGMQTLVKNLISGIFVLVERPFRLGDEIEVGALRGTVVDIDLRASVIRDGDGAETLIPNAALVEQSVRNVTYRSRVTRQSLGITVDPAADPRVVIDAMRDAALRHGQLLASREPSVLLDEFVDDGMRFVMNYWVELVPGMDRRRLASDLRLMVLRALEGAGIRTAAQLPRSVVALPAA